MKEGTFSEERWTKGDYEVDDEEKKYHSYNIPSILVMNKVDLVTSKRRLRTLQNQIEDLCNFEKIFHVSCKTGFGLEALVEFMVERSNLRTWRYHPNQTTTRSEVGKAEEALKQAVMEKFF